MSAMVQPNPDGTFTFRDYRIREVVLAAAARAAADDPIDDVWIRYARTANGFRRKTDFAFYLTALVVRAQTPDADVLSIKSKAGPGGYSANSVVAATVDALAGQGFDLRGLKRAPFNNNPWVDKVRFSPDVRAGDDQYPVLDDLLHKVSLLSPDRAQEALAALLRTVRAEHSFGKHSELAGGEFVGARRAAIIEAVETFLADDAEDGRRCQAFVTAALAAAFGDSVRSGDIHDPSFRWPGDVQLIDGGEPSLVAEAKHRDDVSLAEVITFAETLAATNHARGIYFALGSSNDILKKHEPIIAELLEVVLKVITSVPELLDLCFIWCHPWIAPQFTDRFVRAYSQWLRNLGVKRGAVRMWESLAH